MSNPAMTPEQRKADEIVTSWRNSAGGKVHPLVDAIAQALASARREGMEAAAVKCEERAASHKRDASKYMAMEARACARAIRAAAK